MDSLPLDAPIGPRRCFDDHCNQRDDCQCWQHRYRLLTGPAAGTWRKGYEWTGQACQVARDEGYVSLATVSDDADARPGHDHPLPPEPDPEPGRSTGASSRE